MNVVDMSAIPACKYLLRIASGDQHVATATIPRDKDHVCYARLVKLVSSVRVDTADI